MKMALVLAALLLTVHTAAAVYSECQVSVLENSTVWPNRLIVPPNSTVELYCRLEESTEPNWLIDLAGDTVGALPFSTRRELLNGHNIYELHVAHPQTLGLLINDTNRNNQTDIVCTGIEESRQTTLFVKEPVQVDVHASDIEDVQSLTNVSWSSRNSLTNLDANQSFNLTVTSANTETRTFLVNQTYYVFEAPPNAPPCEVYNFSVTATPVGATYTGDGCSVPSPVLSRMLPSLPDITPIQQSQEYSLRKLILSGVTVVLEVYFQRATYCKDYPVTNYTLECVDDSMKIQFISPKNAVVVAISLSENALYQCTLYASNSVGNISTGYTKNTYTTDVQNVTASEEDGSKSVMIRCDFIPGSDALGCVVILVGEVTNTTVMVDRDDTTGVGVASTELPLPLGCYHDVMAFDVEVDGSNGTLPVPGTLSLQYLTLDQCNTTTVELGPAQGAPVWVFGLVGALLVLVLAAGIVIFGVLLKRCVKTAHQSDGYSEELASNTVTDAAMEENLGCVVEVCMSDVLAEEEESRKAAQNKADAAMEAEQERRIADQEAHMSDVLAEEQASRRAAQNKAVAAMDEEQKRRMAVADVKHEEQARRKTAQKKADAAMDGERKRRIEEDRAHSDEAKRMELHQREADRKKAQKLYDQEQQKYIISETNARKQEEDARKANRIQAKKDMDKEKQRRVNEDGDKAKVVMSPELKKKILSINPSDK